MKRLLLILVAVATMAEAQAGLVWVHLVLAPGQLLYFRLLSQWGRLPPPSTEFANQGLSGLMYEGNAQGGSFDFQQNLGSTEADSQITVCSQEGYVLGVMTQANGWTCSLVPPPRVMHGVLANDTTLTQTYKVYRGDTLVGTYVLRPGETAPLTIEESDAEMPYTITRSSPGSATPDLTRGISPYDPAWESGSTNAYHDTVRASGDTWSADSGNSQLKLPTSDGTLAQESTLGTVGKSLYQVSAAGFERLSAQAGLAVTAAGTANSTLSSMNGYLSTIAAQGPGGGGGGADPVATAAVVALQNRLLATSADIAGLKGSVDLAASTQATQAAAQASAASSLNTAVTDGLNAVKNAVNASTNHSGGSADMSPTTNLLGQILGAVQGAGVTNSNGAPTDMSPTTNLLGQILGAIQGQGTNGSGGGATDLSGISNLVGQIKGGVDATTNILGQIARSTNSGAGTNDIAAVMSEWASKAHSEFNPSETSEQVGARINALAGTMAAPGVDAIHGIPIPTTEATDSFPSADDAWTVSFGGVSADLNPLHISGVSDIAAFVRAFLMWVTMAMFAKWAWEYTEGRLAENWQTPQGTSSVGVPVAGTASAGVMATIIVVSMAVGPVLFAAAWQQWGPGGSVGLGVDPFSRLRVSTSLSIALGMLNHFAPLAFMVNTVLWSFTWRMVMSAYCFATRTLVKLAVG